MLTTLNERTTLLKQQQVEPYILEFTREMASQTAREFMEHVLRDELHVKLLLLGYDNRFGRRNTEETFESYVEYGRELGIEVVLCDPYYMDNGARVSSSYIRDCINNGRTDLAAACFGRPYSIEGTVVEGYHEGRKIGFPTANLLPDPLKLIPSGGVYVSTIRIEGYDNVFHGMSNIGHRPTFGQYGLTIETNIFDFDADIYGRHIQVSFHNKLRNEQRFNSIEELKRQLEHDRLAAQNSTHNFY